MAIGRLNLVRERHARKETEKSLSGASIINIPSFFFFFLLLTQTRFVLSSSSIARVWHSNFLLMRSSTKEEDEGGEGGSLLFPFFPLKKEEERGLKEHTHKLCVCVYCAEEGEAVVSSRHRGEERRDTMTFQNVPVYCVSCL